MLLFFTFFACFFFKNVLCDDLWINAKGQCEFKRREKRNSTVFFLILCVHLIYVHFALFTRAERFYAHAFFLFFFQAQSFSIFIHCKMATMKRNCRLFFHHHYKMLLLNLFFLVSFARFCVVNLTQVWRTWCDLRVFYAYLFSRVTWNYLVQTVYTACAWVPCKLT